MYTCIYEQVYPGSARCHWQGMPRRVNRQITNVTSPNRHFYQLVQQHYPVFKALGSKIGQSLPRYVSESSKISSNVVAWSMAFACSLRGLPPWAFAAFGCSAGGSGPSCGARRMAESAALLVDLMVFPAVPFNGCWVFLSSFCFLLACYPELMGTVLGIVHCTLHAFNQQAGFTRATRANRGWRLIQRFGSALNLTVHFHVVFDGVYAEDAYTAASIGSRHPLIRNSPNGLLTPSATGSLAVWESVACWSAMRE